MLVVAFPASVIRVSLVVVSAVSVVRIASCCVCRICCYISLVVAFPYLLLESR